MARFMSFANWLWAWLIIASSLGCLALGLYLPVLRTERLFFFKQDHNILSAARALYEDHSYGLAAIIVLFAVIIPVIKLCVLCYSLLSAGRSATARTRLVRRIEWLGKWSMGDVFIVALLVFYLKAQIFADAREMTGLYFFAASVLLTMYAAHRVRGLLARMAPGLR